MNVTYTAFSTVDNDPCTQGNLSKDLTLTKKEQTERVRAFGICSICEGGRVWESCS